jgi:hypothetical protein
MVFPIDLADKLIKIELSLKAYQKLHEDELAELWKALDACKRTLMECKLSEEDLNTLPPPATNTHGES